jgi:soluble lytic murein transglycosylase
VFEQGLAHRSLGEYEQAAQDFHLFLSSYPADARADLASFYLAESFVLRRNWASAVAALEQFVQNADPGDPWGARALFLLGRSYEAQGEAGRAADAYGRYAALATPLAPYARLRQAGQLELLGQNTQAADGYEAVAAQPIARVERALAFEQAARLRALAGDAAAAQRLYGQVLALAEVADYRAGVLLAAAAAAAAASDQPQQQTWLAEIVASAPASDAALDALMQLQAAQAAPDPLGAAAVFVAHERWDEARAQYDRAIAAASGDAQLEARRLRALTLREGPQPDYAACLAELAAIGAESPDSAAGRQAQLDWIQTRGQGGDVAEAIAAYREYVQAYPDDPRAPEAWRRLATLLERSGDALAAADERIALAQRYPADGGAGEALAAAGLARYQAGRLPEALQAWQLLAQAPDTGNAVRGAFWVAKIGWQQGHSDAAAALEDVRARAPDSYYGRRAAELLGLQERGSAPAGARLSAAEWNAIRTWVAGWNGGSGSAEVADEPGVVRAVELQRVWLQAEASNEWQELLQGWRDDPARLAGLARVAYEQGLDHVALLAALRIRSLAPETSSVPAELLRLIYPTPFYAAVRDIAGERGIDPLLLYGLLRQESGLDPHATSWVGARGLAQVMPETGRGIAANLGLQDFFDDDLYRPALSIRFGALYLAQQLHTLDGSVPGALAAYNAGLGNAERWAASAPLSDPDLFVEQIDYGETRTYVKLVYGFYGAYQRLYRP